MRQVSTKQIVEEQMEGQMTIFDFLGEPEAEPTPLERQKAIEKEVCDRVFNRIIRFNADYCRLEYSERIELAKKVNNQSGGGCPNYVWNIDKNGIDIKFKELIGKCSAVHIGWPMFDKRYNNEQPVCKHSGHSCNRKELWNIAHTFDEVNCPEVCCRECSELVCGARCNGSKEPKCVIIRGLMDDGYCPDCNSALNDLEKICSECGCLLNWSLWEKINGKE